MIYVEILGRIGNQMFSYAFNTTRDQSEFIDALRLTHPAGTKWFSDTTKTFDHIFNP
jgi:predicted metal-dependent hydrolase